MRGSVEETLSELLEAEEEELTQTARYECNEQRQGYRSGHSSRAILLPLPGTSLSKCLSSREISFETAIIEVVSPPGEQCGRDSH